MRITHGKSGTRTHQAWKNMKARCNNPSRPDYKYYGGRGITYSFNWEYYEKFLIDMGECPLGKELDRLDNTGNYEVTNCIWTDHKTNSRHTRKVLLNAEKVRLIKGLLNALKPGINIRRADDIIGLTFNVSGSAIAHIRLGRSWSDIV